LIKFHSITERVSELRRSREKAAEHGRRIKAQRNISDEIEPTTLFDSSGMACGIFIPLDPKKS
jgi:hypothetical protein